MTKEDFDFLRSFQKDMATSMAGAMTAEKAAEIEALYKDFRQFSSSAGDYFVNASMSAVHGHFEVAQIDASITEIYDYVERKYVSYRGILAGILWNDHSKIEPYNRQAQFYNGASFDSMDLIGEDSQGRTFKYVYQTNISRVIDPFNYNNHWGTIEFQMVVKAGSLLHFLELFMDAVGKQWVHSMDAFALKD